MTSTAETMAQTRYDCLRVSHLEGARLWSDLSEGSQDLFIDREKTFIFALNEVGLAIVPVGLSGDFFGKDCPVGMVQIEFVGCSPTNRIGDHGWKPEKDAFLEVYVDGDRYRITVGDFHDGVAKRRGLHVVGPLDLQAEKTSMNAASLWRDKAMIEGANNA